MNEKPFTKNIILGNAASIRGWVEARGQQVPIDKYSRMMTIQELLKWSLYSEQASKDIEGKFVYRIEHSLGLPDGSTLVRIERTLFATDAEDALEQYIFNDNSRSMEAGNGELLNIIVRDTIKHEPQRIVVYQDDFSHRDLEYLAELEL
jgi:hypothetical protein